MTSNTFAEFSIVFNNTKQPKLFEYLEKIGCDDVDNAKNKIYELLLVAVTVMESVQVSQDVQFVKNEVDKIIVKLENEVDNFSDNLNKSVDSVLNSSLNIDIDSSMVGKMKVWLRDQLSILSKEMMLIKSDAQGVAKLIIDNAQKVSSDKLDVIDKGIKDASINFDPNNSTSYLGKLKMEVIGVQDKIQQMLDFGRTESFSYKLRTQLETFFGDTSPILKQVMVIVDKQQNNINSELIKLREEIAHKEGSTEMLSKTAIKGFLFEDEVEKMLNDFVKPFSDIVTRTSLESKAGRGGKKGDFIYEFSGGDNRIVIETKDEAIGLKPMLAYLKEAMEYRECSFSILCTKTLEQLPAQVGYFNLYEGNKLFCSADFLSIAIKWSKLYLERIKSEKSDAVDVNTIKDKIEAIKNSLKNFTNIKTRLTSIDKTVNTNTDEIRSLLDNIRDEISSSLDYLI